jgi:hypothetical protein
MIKILQGASRFHSYFLHSLRSSERDRAMSSNPLSRERETVLFQTYGVAGKPALWSALTWGVFALAVLVSNIVLAVCAWFVVEWIMKLS